MDKKHLSAQSVQELSEQFLTLLQGSGILPEEDIRALSGKLEKEVIALLRSPKPQIMVYGIYNSGKSTLVNALCEREVAQVADRPMTDRITEYDNGKYILIDSPGIDAPEEHERIADARLSKCHIILFVISSKGGFESRENYVKMLKIIQMGVPFYIILNDRGVALPRDEEERLKAKQQHEAELEGIRRKIIQNLVEVSGDANIYQKYDVIVLNAKRAWTGIERKEDGLVKASNLSALQLRINDILDEGNALIWLKAPLATLDACMSQAESQIYALTGSHDYAEEREVFQAKVTDTRNRLSDQIRNLAYSRFDSVYSYYCGASDQQLDQIGAELTDETQRAYNSADEALSRYVKEVFPNLRKTADGNFTCAPLSGSGTPVADPAGKETYAGNNENLFSSPVDGPVHSGGSGVLGAVGAAALGAAAYDTVSALGSTTIGAAMTEAATAALGSTAAGAAAGTAGKLLSSVVAPIPGLNAGMLLGLVCNLIKSASKRQREEEERYRQMQAEIERANQEILNRVAEQARIRQDARTKANGLLDEWVHQLRAAAEAQLDQIASSILRALDTFMMQQQKAEESTQQLLRQLHTLREELADLRMEMR